MTASSVAAWTLQIIMRSLSRRSFTVEVKSSGRRNATMIPTRVAAPDGPAPVRPDPLREFTEPSMTPAMPKRRILPSLIEPEVPQPGPELAEPVSGTLPPKRPRGRPRKPRPLVEEPAVAAREAVMASPSVSPSPPAAAHMPAAASVPSPGSIAQEPAAQEPAVSVPALQRRPASAPALDLARGERWKRRLGRWSR